MHPYARILTRTVSALAFAGFAVSALHAQDVVVMRRVIAPPTKAPNTDPVNPPVGYYSWKASDWTDPPLACGVEGASTRTVRCARTDDSTADDTYCTGNGAGNKPLATRTITGSCGTGSGGTGSSGGSGGTGTGGDTGTGGGSGSGGGTPTPGVTPTPGSTPSGSTPTPTPDTTPTPTSTGTPTVPPVLTYGWTVGTFGAPSATCGSATSTRTVTCQRSDGGAADPGQCVAAMPTTTQTTYETSGCGYSWREGEWDSPVASCGPTTQTHAVTCIRSDGQTASDASCAATVAKPATSRPSTDYGTCTFAWSVGSYSAPNTTCGTVTQTRTVYCQRADGQTAPQSSCTETKPDVTQTSYDTTGCTYDWDKGAYGTAVSACGASTHSRTVTCKRSDGQAATADKCDADTKPVATEPATSYETCGYDWFVGAWNGATQCGLTVTQTRDVHCQRSNGDAVGDSLCSAKGGKPASSQPITDYTGCSYAWKTTPGAWSNTCSATATRPSNVVCQRSDNAPVAESLCDPAKRPADADTGNYAGCTYAGTYAPTAICTGTPGDNAGTQPTTLSKCTRSDGTEVPFASCTPKTSTQSCTVEVTSDQYAREGYQVRDPSAYSSPRGLYVNATAAASTFSVLTVSTQCWDFVNNKASASATCSQLTRGANVYDVSALPATYVPTLREIYVAQADLQAVAPHSSSFIGGGSISSTCAGSYDVGIGTTAANSQPWTLRCGTPDTADHYSREANAVRSPADNGKYVNTSMSASTLSFYATNTLCWDATAQNTAPARKCAYLPTGANAADILTIPATFVPDLREVYVERADLQAVAPHSNSFLGNNSIATTCAGTYSMDIGTTAANGTPVTVRCGTPDTPGHYVRESNMIRDPGDYTNYVNATGSGNTVSFRTVTTLCWDSTAQNTATTAKCAYLPTGRNVGDVLAIPATYVTDLREIYIQRADLQAVAPHSNSFLGNSSIATTCAGTYSMQIGDKASTQTPWVVRCGTADSAAHYSRQAYVIRDPAAYSKFVNTGPGPTVSFISASTICWDTTAKASVPDLKCAYLPSGVNKQDVFSIAATYVTDLHEIYVSKADLQAISPNTDSFLSNGSLNSTCNGNYSVNIGASANAAAWIVRCGTPDTPDHYYRYSVLLGDPNTYSTGASMTVNDTTKPVVNITTRTTACYDTTAKAGVASVKCDYLPTGDVIGTPKPVPAIWDTVNKIVTVKKTDIAAVFPYNTNYPNAVCGLSYTVSKGVTGVYKFTCQ